MFVLSACHRMPAAASDLAGRIACHSLLLLGLAVASGPAHAEVLRTFEFSRDANLTTQKWLDNRGYELQKHAQDPRRISLYHEGDDLHIVSKKPAFGMVIHEANIPDVTSVRLHWGVSDYPDGVSYERGIDNEAIMVYIFFGHEKLPSGEIFIPDSHYFIVFYLC